MSLQAGAETIVDQCLAVQSDEQVVIVNDANDDALIEALQAVLEERDVSHDYHSYPEPETQGSEPPEHVAAAMKEADVFIAPTKKSITHTRARQRACEAGARGATLPGVTQEIWTTSLMADYRRVEQLSERVFDILSDADELRITTPSGTDMTVDINIDYFETDTGIIHEPGDFGNLPAGEADGGAVNASGTLVIDHFPFAPAGTRVEIEDNRAVSIEHRGEEVSELAEAFDQIGGARNIAEVGIGTNPQATLIGNTLQDEKVLGTCHVAFGDNVFYIPDGDSRQVDSNIHWDTVCEAPTLTADDTVLIDEGEPRFMD